MTPNEWREIVDEIESLWGRTAKWSKATEAYKYATGVPVQAARSAVEELFMAERSTAPPPAEVISKSFRYMETGGADVGRYCAQHGHMRAIIVDEPGRRVWRCSRSCGDETEHEVRPDECPTLAELETGELSEPDLVADRIAP